MKEDEFQQCVDEIRKRHFAIVLSDLRFEVEAGWLPLIDETLGRLEDLLRREGTTRIRVRQVKEKFGQLRIYARPDHGIALPDTTSRGVLKILREAAVKSEQVCEICGEPGEIDVIDHYHQTLCPRHASKRRNWVVAGRPDVDWR